MITSEQELFDLICVECVSLDASSHARALDLLFHAVDKLFGAGEFDVVDAVLPRINPEHMSPTLSIGVLTITFAARDLLKNRPALVDRIRSHFEVTESTRVDDLMRGLE